MIIKKKSFFSKITQRKNITFGNGELEIYIYIVEGIGYINSSSNNFFFKEKDNYGLLLPLLNKRNSGLDHSWAAVINDGR